MCEPSGLGNIVGPDASDIDVSASVLPRQGNNTPSSRKSSTSSQGGGRGTEHQQMLNVYLRVRQFSKEELSDNENQGCVVINNTQTVALHAPKGSASLKNSERGIGIPIHKFSFSQIFGPETTQAELFEGTVKSQVSDYLAGKNELIFSYGVTNAGKTYTIQGTAKDLGILPRVLDDVFQHIGGRQYVGMDLKPYLGSDAQCLGPDQVKQERIAKAAILASLKDDGDNPRVSGQRLSDSSPSPLTRSSSYSLACGQAEPDRGQFALWVAFFEIYNESVYDLLQPFSAKSKKRPALRVCEDSAGNRYVKDLKWINIQSMEEACKILKFGNKNRSAASTKMNQSSSRSHSIFTMKLLNIDGVTVQRISEFSLCDLAGSERCHKTKTFGDRLKEAGNINNSLVILGKCISALRNQNDRAKNNYIPFRESKLTKLFQGIFCGKGHASMIVNINQCASTYDETLHVMKFSAIAKQVVQVIPTKSLESLAPRLVGRDGKPLVRNGMLDLESYLSEEELLDEEEDDADMSVLPQEELFTIIENLRSKLLVERKKNLVQEIEIRKEMGDAMIQQLLESEELRCRQMVELKESYEEKMENTFELYKDAIKEHAYQCAMNSLEENYVPVDEFNTELEKVEMLTRKISHLEAMTPATSSVQPRVETLDQCVQTQASTPPPTDNAAGDARYKRVYKEKCALEKMCEDKQELIISLERRVVGLNETLQHMRDDFLAKSTELEALQEKLVDQKNSIAGLVSEEMERGKEIASLKLEISKLPQSPVPPKVKRSLLANIKESVVSPRTCAIGRTLRKTVRVTPSLRNNSNS